MVGEPVRISEVKLISDEWAEPWSGDLVSLTCRPVGFDFFVR